MHFYRGWQRGEAHLNSEGHLRNLLKNMNWILRVKAEHVACPTLSTCVFANAARDAFVVDTEHT